MEFMPPILQMEKLRPEEEGVAPQQADVSDAHPPMWGGLVFSCFNLWLQKRHPVF